MYVWKAYWFLTFPLFFLFSRTTLGLSLATWVLPASHLQRVLTLMPPCSSPLLFFSPHSSLVISWRQPLHRRRRHHHLLPLPCHLGSQSLLLAMLPLAILSASLCFSSRDIFSNPHHRYVTFSPFNLRELTFISHGENLWECMYKQSWSSSSLLSHITSWYISWIVKSM